MSKTTIHIHNCDLCGRDTDPAELKQLLGQVQVAKDEVSDYPWDEGVRLAEPVDVCTSCQSQPVAIVLQLIEKRQIKAAAAAFKESVLTGNGDC